MNNLTYITFDELMASVESDFSNFADNNLINRGNYIKIARKVNNDIGLKIFRENETVLKVENYKADLPIDFMYLQLALICGEVREYNLAGSSIFGTHTEEKEIPVSCTTPKGACLNDCGGAYWVTQLYKEKTVKTTRLQPIKVSKKSLKFCADNCVNNTWSGAYELNIENGEVVTNFREGDLYINYLADMVDKDNNVLILDHPLLTPFYEYSIKKHILENLLMNGEVNLENKLKYIGEELRKARIDALNFTNTIEYTDIRDSYNANRKRFYNKYFKMFDQW